MKGIFDTHAHYDDNCFDTDREQVLSDMFEKDISYIINCGSNVPSSKRSYNLTEQYENMYATAGVYPLESYTVQPDWADEIEKLAKKEKVVGIGEVGLDYFLSDSRKNIQKEILIRQLEIATELGLPVEIHDRDADEDVLEVLSHFNLSIDIHRIFSEVKYVEAFLERGYMLGIGPQITYPNSEILVKTVKIMPMEQMMLETDCPFLPTKDREGQRAHSSMLNTVASSIADIRGDITAEEVIKITTDNAKRFFKIK